MNIVFMGTPEFAIPTLKKLHEKHNILAVISQPDKPKGRGKKIIETPIKTLAKELGIETIIQPDKIKQPEIVEKLKSLEADLFIVVAYGQILPEEVLNIPKLGCINVHGSLLPKYRGAAPIQWAIINGEEVTGVTIMYMEKGMDTGDMILKKEVPILSDETYGSLYEKMSNLGAEALIEGLELLEQGKINPEKQDDSKATYAPSILKEMGKIDWNKTSEEIINLIRGLNPVPCAFFSYKGDKFKVYNAKEIKNYNGRIGEIVDIIKNEGIVIKTKDSAVLITEIQAKNGKKMLTSAYLRGNTLEKGEIL